MEIIEKIEVKTVDITIEVPATKDGPDESNLPVYKSEETINGVGIDFTPMNEIRFSSDYSEDGRANRKIFPILNENQDLLYYHITKREKIISKIVKPEIKNITLVGNPIVSTRTKTL